MCWLKDKTATSLVNLLSGLFQVKVWFQNRRMKWKRTKGAQVVRDKVTGQVKPAAEVDISLNNLANQVQSHANSVNQGVASMYLND